jgi:competence ComEA-like helix-hairpin-helix protein
MQKNEEGGLRRRPVRVYAHAPTPLAMPILFRLQNHLALTQIEARTLAAIGLLLLGGLIAQRVPTGVDAAALDASPRAERFAALADSLAAAVPADAPSAEAAETPSADADAAVRPVRAAVTLYVNLNTATQAELEALPRIGPKTAERILELRARQGAFARPEDLTRVRGIGPKTMDRLRPLVHVGS